MSRQHIHMPAHLGDKVADAVVLALGSWRFIIIQTVIVLAWIAANLYLLSRPFDPYPFILLNLLFSTQAAYASPLILMAGNRAAARDRLRDDLEAQEVAGMFANHDELLSINRTLLAMQEQQMDILAELHKLRGKAR